MTASSAVQQQQGLTLCVVPVPSTLCRPPPSPHTTTTTTQTTPLLLLLPTQVALKNSPLNAGKKALAKAQAGDYDAAATRAKIEKYIKDNKVMVFSW